MFFEELRISDFRCFKQAQLKPDLQLNVITGANGSGKTSLLEALYFLSRADSFRRGRRQRIIRNGANQFTVFARFHNREGSGSAGVESSGDESRLRLNGNDSAVQPQLRALPVLHVDPSLHELLDDGPEYRRRFLDWAVFHVEPQFIDVWRRYKRALQQRNHVLRNKGVEKGIAAWEPELASSGERLHAFRLSLFERLIERLPEELPDSLKAVACQYAQGWPADRTLLEALAEQRGSDREMGFTQRGPHRADMRFRLAEVSLTERASRGQQKLVALGLHLAVAAILKNEVEPPVLLIDDLAAELDTQSRQWMLARLSDCGMQVFLTFLDAAQTPANARMFHVEHGVIRGE